MPRVVYIMASDRYGTLYVGYANDLLKRVWEHKTKVVAGFTSEHRVDKLVWFELHESVIAEEPANDRLRSGIAIGR
ncbi:MAG: GIY-YIG nuclease family protein [Burkholderiales bacterium]